MEVVPTLFNIRFFKLELSVLFEVLDRFVKDCLNLFSNKVAELVLEGIEEHGLEFLFLERICVVVIRSIPKLECFLIIFFIFRNDIVSIICQIIRYKLSNFQ